MIDWIMEKSFKLLLFTIGIFVIFLSITSLGFLIILIYNVCKSILLG